MKRYYYLTSALILFLFFTVFIFISCKGGGSAIKGKTGDTLTDGKIELQALSIFRQGNTYGEKEWFGVILIVKNIQSRDIEVKWANAEYSGKDIQDNYWWAPVIPNEDDWNQYVTVQGIVGHNPTKEEISEKEKELKFPSCKLATGKTCKSLIYLGGTGGTPNKIEITIPLADGTVLGPFVIEIADKNTDKEGKVYRMP